MSVINDMLRDLEARKAPEREAPVAGVVADIIEPQAERPRLVKWLPVLLIVLCAGALGVYGWLSGLDDSTTPSIPTKETTSPDIRGLSGQQESTEQRSMTIAATTTKPQLPAPADASAREPVRLEPSSVSVEKSTPLPVQVAQNVDISSTSTGATPDPEPVVAQRQPSVMVDKMREERSAPIAQTSSTDIGAQTKSASIGAVASTKDNGSSQPAPTTNQIVLSPFAKDHAMVREARALFAEGEDNLAYRKLYDFLAAHEQDDQSRALLAGQLMQEGRYAEAGDVLLAVRDIDNPDLRQMKARWYMHQGESDLALHTLRERQPELTDYPEYYALLASYYQQMGYPQQAARLYGKLVEFDADAADWWAGLAIALDRQSRFEEGKLAYSRAIQLPGLNPSLQDFIQQRLNALTQ